MDQFNHLLGTVFNKMTIVSISHKDKHSNLYVDCECECGVTKKVTIGSLRSGNVKSCGCYNRSVLRELCTKHGCSDSPEYKAWINMKTRCFNVEFEQYLDYGGRGITVYSGWVDNFSDFLLYVGKRPTPLHSFDRINNDGDYEPGNVRWATKKEQVDNRRNSIVLTHNGVSKCVSDWARYFGVRPNTLSYHLKKKSIKEVFEFYEMEPQMQ